MSVDREWPLPPVYLRTVGERDLAAVRELLVTTWHATYDSIYGPERVSEINDDWHSIRALRERLGNPQAEFVLADDGERILAVAYATAHGDHVDLKQLYVLPEAQGRGIGRMLVAEIGQCFEEAHAIFLEVETANRRAIRFYSGLGFLEVDRRQSCNGVSGFNTVLLRKALS